MVEDIIRKSQVGQTEAGRRRSETRALLFHTLSLLRLHVSSYEPCQLNNAKNRVKVIQGRKRVKEDLPQFRKGEDTYSYN